MKVVKPCGKLRGTRRRGVGSLEPPNLLLARAYRNERAIRLQQTLVASGDRDTSLKTGVARSPRREEKGVRARPAAP